MGKVAAKSAVADYRTAETLVLVIDSLLQNRVK